MVIGVIALIIATVLTTFFIPRFLVHSPKEGTVITVDGTTVCLPHKDRSGETTLECAIGLQADDGRYWAWRQEQTDRQVLPMQINSRVQVTGTLVEPEANERYDITGIIDATSVIQK